MLDYVSPQFSKSKVVGAGKLLKSSVIDADQSAIEAFRIAHNWRSSHILPMRHLRMELSAKVRRIDPDALTAARLKRMISIRAKLKRLPHTLYQMQDIAGCRAIMADPDAVNRLLALYLNEAKHIFVDHDDYVIHPKATGYRGHHLVYRYHGKGSFDVFNCNPQFVEIQLRTKLQHAWATAVEAVGMVRGEDLKSGKGSSDWLRFFALMSSEIAAIEGSTLVPDTPSAKDDRRDEILALEVGLNALQSLENYRNAVSVSEYARTASPFFLIQFDQSTLKVTVRGVSARASSTSLDEAEKNGNVNSVLVSVDKASDLRTAYPNYFMDVGLFAEQLRAVVKPKPRVSIDTSWLRAWINGSTD
jgi:hypothetical protein